MKSYQELTVQKLNSKKKKLVILLTILSGMIILFAVYFIAKLVSATWQANNTLGIVFLGVSVVLISNMTIQLSAIQKELKSRNDNH